LEAGGELEANDPEFRRVDVSVEVDHRVRTTAGMTQKKTMAAATTDWAINIQYHPRERPAAGIGAHLGRSFIRRDQASFSPQCPSNSLFCRFSVFSARESEPLKEPSS
jgi:hypothetical protein